MAVHIHTFAFPFVKAFVSGNSDRVVYAVNGALGKPEDLADKFQVFD